MARKQKSRSQVSWKSGNVTGSQIVLGEGNVLTVNKATGISQAELVKLLAEFSNLKQQIEVTVPPEKKAEALNKADELQTAILDKKPNPSQMASVRDWFVKNAPGIAGAVTSLVVNPIVGKLVAAAGDAIAGQFRRHFGSATE